jgi:predicted nucleic acid-binding protein
MDAFDADVLIYAAADQHPLGRRVRALFAADPGTRAGVGSVLLVPEVLAKPMRDGQAEELTALAGLLSRLDLRILDAVTAEVATSLAATHRLRAADAVHLATALVAGADRFVTNNRRDFPDTFPDITVTYPNTLPDPSAG